MITLHDSRHATSIFDGWFLTKVYKQDTYCISMADNRVSMPASTAGLTRYFDDYKSKIEISPGTVIILGILIIIVAALLHAFGNLPA